MRWNGHFWAGYNNSDNAVGFSTRISYKSQNFNDQRVFIAVLAIFLCECAETPSFLLPVRNLLIVTATSISYESMEILTILQHCSCLRPYVNAHAQKRQFLSFRLQFWQRHWIQRPRFLIKVENFGNRKTFTAVLDYFSLHEHAQNRH